MTDLAELSDADLMAALKAAPDVAGMVTSEAQRQGVDPALAMSVAHAESGLDPSAVSPKGAKGVMQLMPKTAAGLGVDPNDVADNIRGGVTYLKQQTDHFKDPALAVAAYNAGPGAVTKAGGVPAYPETQAYVGKVMGDAQVGKMSDADLRAALGLPAPAQAAPAGAAPKPMGVPVAARPAVAPLPFQQGGSEPAVAHAPSAATMTAFAAGKPLPAAQPPRPHKSSIPEQYAGGFVETARPYIEAADPLATVNRVFGTHIPTQIDLAYMLTHGGRPVPQAPAPETGGQALARSLGQNTLNAAAPGSAALKIASVVMPSLGQQGAQKVAKMAGLGPRGQAVAGVAGSVAGGLMAGGLVPRKAPQVMSATDASAAQAVKAAMAVDGATPADVTAGLDQGRLPLATSPGLAQLGETVTTLPGAGQVAIRSAAAARMGTQTDRAMSAMESHLGVSPESARGDIDAMVSAGQAKARPLYDAITADPAPVWTPDLAKLAERPAIKKAIGVVTNDMLNAGQNPKVAGFGFDPDTGWQLGPSSPGSLKEVQQLPTAATWDAVYKAMGRTVERHPLTNAPLPDSVSSGNRGITTATGDLRAALAGDPANGVQGAIPGYGGALSTSGDYLSTAGAFNRARGKLMSGPVYDFENLWKSAKTPAEQDAIRSAVANDVLEASDRGKIEPGLFRSPGVQKKLGIAFGDQAQPFIAQMENDLAERNIYSRITGGSQTASRQALIDQLAAQNKPSGVAGLLGKGLIAAEWAQSAMHPALLATKLAHAALDATGKSGKSVPLPWENPEVSARLGSVLSDPHEMTGLLEQMDLQAQARNAASAQSRQGLLTAPVVAGGSAVTGLLAPSQVQARPRRAK